MFNFHRFLNVARWDLTVNSRFYLRAALLMVAIISSPVLLYYLYNLAFGEHLSGYVVTDNIETLGAFTTFLGCTIYIISSGYMFHNLLTKQGRINELTLPATNLERFLWHFVVIVIGIQVVWFVGVAFADLLHVLFRLAIPNAEIKSLFSYLCVDVYSYSDFEELGKYGIGVVSFFIIMSFCYSRSFCLFNAWKYRYNIPWTFLFHFILWNVLGVLSIFIIFNCFDSPREVEKIWNWLNDGGHVNTVLVCMNILAALLYIGIWFLTYRLYTRAQLTTKRNP